MGEEAESLINSAENSHERKYKQKQMPELSKAKNPRTEDLFLSYDQGYNLARENDKLKQANGDLKRVNRELRNTIKLLTPRKALCKTCNDIGTIFKHVGTTSISGPCPDCWNRVEVRL